MPPQVSAILLAAGLSRRMGQIKQLLPVGDTPVISRCLETLVSSEIREIVVVIPRNEEIVNIVRRFPTTLAYNENPSSDMAESVRVGLASLTGETSGILVFLSDHPLVAASTVRMIVDAHAADPDKIIIPQYNKRRGHPTLFPASVLKGIRAGENLREVINRCPDKVLPVDVLDEGVILDMDTEEDYRLISERALKSPS